MSPAYARSATQQAGGIWRRLSETYGGTGVAEPFRGDLRRSKRRIRSGEQNSDCVFIGCRSGTALSILHQMQVASQRRRSRWRRCCTHVTPVGSNSLYQMIFRVRGFCIRATPVGSNSLCQMIFLTCRKRSTTIIATVPSCMVSHQSKAI